MNFFAEWGIPIIIGGVIIFFLSRIRKENIGDIVSAIRSIIVGSMLIMFFSATASMAFFDVIAGGGGVYLLTRGSVGWSTFISFATTGVLMVTILLSDDSVSDKMGMTKAGRNLTFGIQIVVMIIDAVLDSFFADFLGYGQIMWTSVVPAHWMLRVLIGLLSIIGEHVSLFILFKFEEIENLFMDILPDLGKKSKKTNYSSRSKSSKSSKSSKNNKKNSGKISYKPSNNRTSLHDERLKERLGELAKNKGESYTRMPKGQPSYYPKYPVG